MANLIPVGTAAADSADITLLATDTVLINLFMNDTAVEQIAPDCAASLQVKASNNSYQQVAVLNAANPAQLISGPGVYRVRKKGSTNSFGVDKT